MGVFGEGIGIVARGFCLSVLSVLKQWELTHFAGMNDAERSNTLQCITRVSVTVYGIGIEMVV